MNQYFDNQDNTKSEAKLHEIVETSSKVLSVEVTVAVEIPLDYLFEHPTEGLDNLSYLHQNVLEAAIRTAIVDEHPGLLEKMSAYWQMRNILYSLLDIATPGNEELMRQIWDGLRKLAEQEGFEHKDPTMVSAFAQKGVILE